MAANPDLALWRSVLVLGLHHAANGRDTEWIGSPDFRKVCSLAQVDPDEVLEAYVPERFARLPRAAWNRPVTNFFGR